MTIRSMISSATIKTPKTAFRLSITIYSTPLNTDNVNDIIKDSSSTNNAASTETINFKVTTFDIIEHLTLYAMAQTVRLKDLNLQDTASVNIAMAKEI